MIYGLDADEPYTKNKQMHKIWKVTGLISKLKKYVQV